MQTYVSTFDPYTMMIRTFRTMTLAGIALVWVGCSSGSAPQTETTAETMASNESKAPVAMTSLYDQDFRIKTLDGRYFDLKTLKGKRLLLVNTASECGFTPQYKQLQELYVTYGGKSFEIVGFPANNFGGQEPGTNDEIASFCEKNYGVTFPMMEKISVKGEDIHPIYQWLTEEGRNGVKDFGVKWNFQKYLIDEEGHWVDGFLSNKSPLSDEIIAFAQGQAVQH